ncbi:hypothetical protein BVC93_31530 (plasmid) [Mycobacterium sp. MS1601]|uniref:hypothetical protein n=1 Tax=Mycobacterium sp. MS1601 TaxID=1936029 RepID=UPI0009791611|nr:hypothetical protein [Mycobacterium sp. MS1601]AQA07026.1 hypothetical protein BVC93_31530 [Mycobacterium sp. MS1601]
MSLGFVPVVELDGSRTILVAPADGGGDGGPLEEQLGEHDACARAVVHYMHQGPTRVWWLDDSAADPLYYQLWDAGVNTQVPNVPDDLPSSVFAWRYLINHDKQLYVDLALVRITYCVPIRPDFGDSVYEIRRNPLPILAASTEPRSDITALRRIAGAWQGDRLSATNDLPEGLGPQPFPYAELATMLAYAFGDEFLTYAEAAANLTARRADRVDTSPTGDPR